MRPHIKIKQGIWCVLTLRESDKIPIIEGIGASPAEAFKDYLTYKTTVQQWKKRFRALEN